MGLRINKCKLLWSSKIGHGFFLLQKKPTKIGKKLPTPWGKLRKFFDGKETTIAVTGLPGSGKSLLCDYLTGKAYQRDYQKPGKSEKLEKGKVSTKNLNILGLTHCQKT
jgi:Cdc6-like AAA superfamily ATPase